MSTRFVSWLAVGLWGVTALGGGVMFMRGHVESSPDGRVAVILNADERDLILKEMRGMLAAVDTTLLAMANNNRAAIQESARTVGMASMRDVPPALLLKLPMAFKQLGHGIHSGFDDLAAAAAQGETNEKLLDRVGNLLSQCVACHGAYRFR
ncbi:MAG: hypothetical protein HQL37_10055 [Alphaproteobacteria bacterium]|nr:hypothetical protein [Alphaproteobacteria bacterium]